MRPGEREGEEAPCRGDGLHSQSPAEWPELEHGPCPALTLKIASHFGPRGSRAPPHREAAASALHWAPARAVLPSQSSPPRLGVLSTAGGFEKLPPGHCGEEKPTAACGGPAPVPAGSVTLFAPPCGGSAALGQNCASAHATRPQLLPRSLAVARMLLSPGRWGFKA